MKEDPNLQMQSFSESDDSDELLLLEAFGKPPAAERPPEQKEEEKEMPLDVLMHKKGTVFDDSIVQEREKLLSRVVGKTFTVRYRWFIWDDPNMSEASILEHCRALLEDHHLLVYDGVGDLKYRLPLNQVMFRAFESMINIAWFDEEHDSIYYNIEMLVDLF